MPGYAARRRPPRAGAATMASRNGRTSSSESVRSCAWNVSRSASERRPAPSASASRQTSNTCTSLSSSPPAVARGRQHGARGVLVGDDDRDVLPQRRELRERQRPRRVAEALAQAVEVELDAHDGIVEAVAARGQRVQLAHEAERLLAGHLHEALAPGMQERVVRRPAWPRRGRSRRRRRGSTRARPCRGRTRPARRRAARRRRRGARA